MIIFDLDGTLADCEHRRHFVDQGKLNKWTNFNDGDYYTDGLFGPKVNWKPNWPAFYDACDKDTPIMPVFEIMFSLDKPYEIWSGRCESVRNKTEEWLCHFMHRSEMPDIKMRPIGDNTPDDQLKERWLDEAISQGKTIDFVFDDRPKVVRMWRRRGIFVFGVNQEKEF